MDRGIPIGIHAGDGQDARSYGHWDPRDAVHAYFPGARCRKAIYISMPSILSIV